MSDQKKKYLYRYAPAVAQGEGAEFSGHVVLRVPSVSERLYFTDEVDYDLEGMAPKGDKMAAAKKNLRPMARALEKIEGYFEAVELKHLESGDEYQSYGDLAHDPRCSPILFEAYGLFMRGFAPSKN